jgi:hypothetical protein
VSLLRLLHCFFSSFHPAEGPGGFIEAFCEFTEQPEDTYTGMTLIDNNRGVRLGKGETFLKGKNVCIESGLDLTGNILPLKILITWWINTAEKWI